jgi:hypothetical protein
VAVGSPSEPEAPLVARSAPVDTAVYVDHDAAERGGEAPLFVAYCSPDRDRHRGYLRGNCDTFDNATDSMGRLECNACANSRKPDRRDAAHG